ncbi:MAG: DUF3267 domain-containing protein [Bacteroidales bacterium]|nr:MAG: DUF3267 domain-containing protein [Bacteroidales bacterium]
MKSKHYKVEDLSDEKRFSLLLSLGMDDIVSFVLKQIRILNPATSVFYSATIFSFVYMVHVFLHSVIQGPWGWGIVLFQCFNGFVLWPLLLIPLHELIHAVIYKLNGAPKIKFGVRPEYYMFYVTADKFVIGRNQFLLVAFGPFLLISGLLVWCIIFFNPPLMWSFVICLFVHTTMCIGDFALAGFLMKFRENEIYTFDDMETGISYFYKKDIKEHASP